MQKLRTMDVERERREEISAPPAAPADAQPFALSPGVRVVYGAGVQTMSLAGLTVSQARDAAVVLLGVDRRAPTLVNGRPARLDYRIGPEDELEFVHHAGEKG